MGAVHFARPFSDTISSGNGHSSGDDPETWSDDLKAFCYALGKPIV
jgi:hypothetical protein